METQSKRRLVDLLSGMIDLVFWAGTVFSCFLVGLFLFSCVFHRAIPHLYDPQLSINLVDPPQPIVRTQTSTESLAFGVGKAKLFAVEKRSPGFLALQLGWIALQPGLTLLIVWLIRGIVHAIRAGEPFHERSADRLNGIGWLIIIGALGRTSEDFLAGLYARSHYSLAKGSIELSFDLGTLFWGAAVGLMILVLAEVFRYGYVIHQEHNLTI
jgi:hypothetical protein